MRYAVARDVIIYGCAVVARPSRGLFVLRACVGLLAVRASLQTTNLRFWGGAQYGEVRVRASAIMARVTFALLVYYARMRK